MPLPRLLVTVTVTVTVIRAMVIRAMVTGTAMGEMATVLPPREMAVMVVTAMEVRGRRAMVEAHREMVRLSTAVCTYQCPLNYITRVQHKYEVLSFTLIK